MGSLINSSHINFLDKWMLIAKRNLYNNGNIVILKLTKAIIFILIVCYHMYSEGIMAPVSMISINIFLLSPRTCPRTLAPTSWNEKGLKKKPHKHNVMGTRACSLSFHVQPIIIFQPFYFWLLETIA